MSGAREVAKRAELEIEELLSDMFAGNYQDNEISLGFLSDLNGKPVQVQLKITNFPGDFLEGEGPDYDFE